jgi:hypothetical protein
VEDACRHRAFDRKSTKDFSGGEVPCEKRHAGLESAQVADERRRS